MKKQTIKYLSVFLCAAVVTGSVGGIVYGLTKDDTKAVTEKTVQTSDTQTTSKLTENEISKDETVYVLAHADGSVNKVIVSDWIKNAIGSDKIKDSTELKNVENVKGDETYTIDKDNMRVWDADGNDIYYQGDINKELPVDMTVSYTLDGESISPEDLAGKSGHVTMRFDYQNNIYENVQIDGKTEQMYVPFAMLTGVLMDNKKFTNVDVSNGKVINDGTRTAVVGIAFPGLQHNFNINSSEMEIPSYVEISADVKNFEMNTTMTVATNELFNQLDTSKIDSLDSLGDSLNDLTKAMDQLMDGSSKLYDGLCQLLDKSSELVKGVDALATGAERLKTGAASLDQGAAKLQQGAASLSTGLSTLASNNDSLVGGAKQVFDTLLSTANTQLDQAGVKVPKLTIDNYQTVLGNIISSVDKDAIYKKALEKVTKAVEANRTTIEAGVKSAVKEQVTAKVTEAVQAQVTEKVTAAVRDSVAEKVVPAATKGAMTKAQYDAAVAANAIPADQKKAIEGAIDQQMQTEAIQQTIASKVAEQMTSASIKATITAQTDAQMASDAIKNTIADNTEIQINKIVADKMASDEIQKQIKDACAAAAPLVSLKTSLDSYNAFYQGLISYTNGVSEAATGAKTLNSGAKELKSGTAELSKGANQLYGGIIKLKNGTPSLIQGITQLKNGSMKLDKGLQEFNKKGVKKLVDAVDGDLGDVVTRVKATVDVSKDYKSFAGVSDDMDGQVKFIYRTDSIKASKDK